MLEDLLPFLRGSPLAAAMLVTPFATPITVVLLRAIAAPVVSAATPEPTVTQSTGS